MGDTDATVITTDEDVKAADAAIAADLAGEDEQQSSEEDSSTSEGADKGAKDAEADEDKSSETEGDAESEAGDEPDESSETDETKDESSKPKGAQARKDQLRTEIRTLVGQRNNLRKEIESANGKVYVPKTQEELESEGMEPAEARVKALEERQELAEFNTKVSDLNANMDVESLQVMADFPMFDPGPEGNPNPDFNESLAKLASKVYKQVAGVEVDENTNLVISARVLPYQFYQSFAQAYEMGAETGQTKGQREADENEAQAETRSSAKPPTPKEDPFLKGLQPQAR